MSAQASGNRERANSNESHERPVMIHPLVPPSLKHEGKRVGKPPFMFPDPPPHEPTDVLQASFREPRGCWSGCASSASRAAASS